MSQKYEDMLHLPHHVSPVHPGMTIQSRAAQFAPFAALTGYEAAIRETARLTHQRVELDESEKARLDGRLRLLLHALPERPTVSLTYFQPDGRKAGGACLTVTGVVRRIDPIAGRITMMDGTHIPVEELLGLEGALFAALERGPAP